MSFIPYFTMLFLATGASFAAGALPAKKGQLLPEARKHLLAAGWKPRPTELKFTDGTLQKESAESGLLLNAGYKEIEYCTGIGADYCFFNYVQKGHCLRLVTAGEPSPPDQWPVVTTVTFECPSESAINGQP